MSTTATRAISIDTMTDRVRWNNMHAIAFPDRYVLAYVSTDEDRERVLAISH